MTLYVSYMERDNGHLVYLYPISRTIRNQDFAAVAEMLPACIIQAGTNKKFALISGTKTLIRWKIYLRLHLINKNNFWLLDLSSQANS